MKIHKKKGRFDLFNFFYGAGAAIVLIAAIFKFTGSENADTVFVTGISVEAMVFLISAFQWKKEEASYRWERIFPELLDNADRPEEQRTFIMTVEQIYRMMDNIRRVGTDIEIMARLVNHMNNSIQQLTETQRDLLQTSEDYRIEVEKLKDHARKINDQASKLISIAI